MNGNVKPGHVIHTLMEEHKMMLEFVDNLGKTVKSLKKANSFDSVSGEIATLEHIAEHLVEANKHHQREEDSLFPALSKYGIVGPVEAMVADHNELKKHKQTLYKIVRGRKELTYKQFVGRVELEADYLIGNLPNHINKEDNILYPMALNIIPKAEWGGIKDGCDKIGYCCFTPKF